MHLKYKEVSVLNKEAQKNKLLNIEKKYIIEWAFAKTTKTITKRIDK